MVISVIGATHQKCPREVLEKLLGVILSSHPEHQVRIDEHFAKMLRTAGIEVPAECIDDVVRFPRTDLLLCIGGDGTFLRAAGLVAGTDSVILGVNTGRLGFLANMLPDEVSAEWEHILRGESETEIRDLIVVKSEGVRSLERSALNEIAVLKRDTASMIGVETYVNGDFLATYEGDGVIVSTPTGSTAYALSVNGPIIYPQCPTLSICPIAPHMLNMRPIVVPNDVVINMRITSRNDTFLLSTDGGSVPLHSRSEITIRRSAKQLRMLKHPTHSFFHTLRHKLLWGQDMRNGGIVTAYATESNSL